jgi:hypothetical protein
MGCNRAFVADCVEYIGTPDLRSPIMRRPCVDREDDPAPGKRLNDARSNQMLGACVVCLPALITVPDRKIFEKKLAKCHAIKRPHLIAFR